MSIGQNIKKYRKEKGYTQRELADMVGVSVQAVSKWETEVGAPDISQIVPLASALNISTDELFGYACGADYRDWAIIKEDYHPINIFREQNDSDKNYEYLYPYCLAHPRNPKAASFCLKCLVDMIAAGNVQGKSKEELIAECEKYADCISKYENDADAIFMNRFVLARGYFALGEEEKGQEILQRIPTRFGDRLYWEAEIAQANKDYDTALVKCRANFAQKARFISRCIRMAREIHAAQYGENDYARQLEYDEYMFQITNAFLLGGTYLPCRQVFHRNGMLHDMVWKLIKLEQYDAAVDKAELLFAGREEYINFLKAPQNCTSLLFENNDSLEDQKDVKQLLDSYVEETVRNLKTIPDYMNNQRIRALLEKYGLL